MGRSKPREVANNVKKSKPSFGGKSCTTREDLLELLVDGNLEEFITLSTLFFVKVDKDERGDSFLHRIVVRTSKDGYDNNKKNILQLILREAPDMTSYKNIRGDTPLMLACQDPICPELIICLAHANPESIQEQNKFRDIPLLYFLQKMKVGTQEGEINLEKCCEIIDLLSNNKSAVNNADPKFPISRNPLSVLFQRHDLNNDVINCIAEILFKNDVKLISEGHRHAFSYLKSISFKLLQLVMIFCPDEVLKVDNNKWSVVHYIIEALGKEYENRTPKAKIEKDKKDIVKPLRIVIKNNPIPSSLGFKLIYNASHIKCHFKVIQFLMQNTLNFNLDKWYTLKNTIMLQYGTCIENINELIKFGANVNVTGPHQPLHVASKAHCKEGVIKLLSAGANPISAITLSTKKDKEQFLNFIILDDNLDILKYVLQTPAMKNQANSQKIEESYSQIIDLILLKVRNEQLTIRKLQVVREESYTANTNFWRTEMCDVFNNDIVSLDLLSYKLAHTNYKINLNMILRNLRLMLEAGFMIQDNLNNNCLNPLTVFLLTVRNPKQEYIDIIILPVVDLLLKYNVNFNSMALTNYPKLLKDEWITESCMNVKTELKIPDALFLSLWFFRSVELVQRFLVHWWGPPVVLTAVLPTYQNKRWEKRYTYYNRELLPFLIKFGHIPFGSSLISKQVATRIKLWRQGRKSDSGTAKLLNTKQPLMLQDLCKYEVRHMLSIKVNIPDVFLSELINQVLPFDLPTTIYNVLPQINTNDDPNSLKYQIKVKKTCQKM